MSITIASSSSACGCAERGANRRRRFWQRRCFVVWSGTSQRTGVGDRRRCLAEMALCCVERDITTYRAASWLQKARLLAEMSLCGVERDITTYSAASFAELMSLLRYSTLRVKTILISSIFLITPTRYIYKGKKRVEVMRKTTT